jgi:SAM-dependent methyltransferase
VARTESLFQHYYYDQPGFVSGTDEFHAMCAAAARVGMSLRIVEFGAGPSNATSRFLSSLGSVTGVDIDEEVLSNDALAQAIVYDGSATGLNTASYDLCVSNYLLEHLADPAAHFREVARLLRPGGQYVFRTPNMFHYVAVAAAVLPHRIHEVLANRLRSLDGAHAPYPTFYRANSRGRLTRLAADAGLRVLELRMVEREPVYGRTSPLLFYPMLLYERLVNRTPALGGIRSNIFGVAAAEDLPEAKP